MRLTRTRTMMVDLLQDMGFSEAQDCEGGFNDVPLWAYELAERILEAGWRRK